MEHALHKQCSVLYRSIICYNLFKEFMRACVQYCVYYIFDCGSIIMEIECPKEQNEVLLNVYNGRIE